MANNDDKIKERQFPAHSTPLPDIANEYLTVVPSWQIAYKVLL